MNASATILKALAVACELTNTTLSEQAARVFAADLARYPEDQVLAALDRCRREIRTRLTPADVIARLDDGRPTPDEAWAQCPHDDRQTVVWTVEMAAAWGVANEAGSDRVAARNAFLAAYRRMVSDARDQAVPVQWTPSLGTNMAGRGPVIEDAVRLGRLGVDNVNRLAIGLESGLHPRIAEKVKMLEKRDP